jgi:hypothetical protein
MMPIHCLVWLGIFGIGGDRNISFSSRTKKSVPSGKKLIATNVMCVGDQPTPTTTPLVGRSFTLHRTYDGGFFRDFSCVGYKPEMMSDKDALAAGHKPLREFELVKVHDFGPCPNPVGGRKWFPQLNRVWFQHKVTKRYLKSEGHMAMKAAQSHWDVISKLDSEAQENWYKQRRDEMQCMALHRGPWIIVSVKVPAESTVENLPVSITDVELTEETVSVSTVYCNDQDSESESFYSCGSEGMDG